MKKVIEFICEPARFAWNEFTPTGRVFFFVPFTLVAYVFIIVIGPAVLFTDWLDTLPWMKRMNARLNALLLKNPSEN